MPGYDPTTNRALPPITYDNNGNLTYDTLNNYVWYVDDKLESTDSTTCGIFGSTNGTCILYDAFGREVERGINGVYKEVMYTPMGKTAIMNSETSTMSAYFPLPGGATYYQTGSANGTGYFWHKDWLGSARLSSSVLNRTCYYDRAFAPYGEMYKNFCGNTGGLNFTGDTQDSFTGLFDTPNRELHPGQGRWLSPDPAGLGAANPANPQTWNRYAYVGNNPVGAIDPNGLGSDCPGGPNRNQSCNAHRPGGMFTWAGGQECIVDGAPTQCGMAFSLFNTGAADICLNAQCTSKIDAWGQVSTWVPPSPGIEPGFDAPIPGHWASGGTFNVALGNLLPNGDVPIGMDFLHCNGCAALFRNASGTMNAITGIYAVGFGIGGGALALSEIAALDALSITRLAVPALRLV